MSSKKKLSQIPPEATGVTRPSPVKTLDDPDFIGAEAALKRAAAKAIARDLAAGLEPIVRSHADMQTASRP